jgi:radical SAM superfamily enzyme YgiQ (UPF0313 family)
MKAWAIHLLPSQVPYVAAILRDQGHALSYHTGPHEPQYDLAVVFTSVPSHRVDVAFLRRLRAARVPSVVVGTLAGAVPESYGDANALVRGEPEAFFGRPWDVATIAGGRGDVVEAGQVADLDTLPFPDWSIFPRLDSRYAIVRVRGTVLPVVASRGCPYSCGYYCPYPLSEGRAMRFRDPASVVAELEMLRRRHGVTAVKFRDPIFTVNRTRTLALLEAMERAGTGMTFGCETHLDALDDELLDRMARAGCRLIQTGIETVQGAVAAAARRRSATASHQEAMLQRCRALGIRTAIYFIVGLPADTLAGMRASLDHARRLPATYIQTTVSTPYPGTAFHRDVRDRLVTDDLDALDQYTPVLRSESYTGDELTAIMARGYRRFYLRPGWLRDYAAVTYNGWRASVRTARARPGARDLGSRAPLAAERAPGRRHDARVGG